MFHARSQRVPRKNWCCSNSVMLTVGMVGVVVLQQLVLLGVLHKK